MLPVAITSGVACQRCLDTVFVISGIVWRLSVCQTRNCLHWLNDTRCVCTVSHPMCTAMLAKCPDDSVCSLGIQVVLSVLDILRLSVFFNGLACLTLSGAGREFKGTRTCGHVMIGKGTPLETSIF